MRSGRQQLDGEHGDVELAFVEWGPPNGRPTLCVHGLTRNARDFDPLAAALGEAGARVLAVDVVGRGQSSWLADPNDYAVPVYAAQFARFLKLRGLPEVDWIGTSMGGLIGMTVAASDESPIRRLVLNDIGPMVPQPALAMIALYLGRELRFSSLAELEGHLRTIHAGFGPLTDPQWRHLATYSARQDADGWRLAYDPMIKVPFTTAAATDIDLWELWPRIACPTLVLRGELSPILTVETATRMAETGPRARVRTLPGIGHAPALMADDQIDIVRDWLSE